jgi:L-serine dehydratase
MFDVIGPNMIGPSSSHTAGACSMALLARKMAHFEVKKVVFTLYGSFARTYHGHGTDKALVGGILGFSTDDERIRDSFELAKEAPLDFSFDINTEDKPEHPNTADILMTGETPDETLMVRGVSIGGGKIKITKINDITIEFTGEYNTLIVKQTDLPGVVAHLTAVLANNNINIAFMRLFREGKGGTAFTVIESDDFIPDSIIEEMKDNKKVKDIMLIGV